MTEHAPARTTLDPVRPPLAGDEVALLTAFVDQHRAALLAKAAGLDHAQLHRALPPTTMTLGGMLKHLAFVEQWWCREVLHGAPPRPPWDGVDWTADDDWDWHSAVHDEPDALRALYVAAVEDSRAAVAEVLDDPDGAGLDHLAVRERHGARPSLRWVLLHLLEEYAQHLGHADLLREAVDAGA